MELFSILRASVISTTREAAGPALLCLVVANSGHQWEKWDDNNLSVPHSDKEVEIWKETAIAVYCVVKAALKIRQKREKSQKQLTAGCNQTV